MLEISHITGLTHLIGGFSSILHKVLDCLPFIGTVLSGGILLKHVNHLINCGELKGRMSDLSKAMKKSTDVRVWQVAVRKVLDSRNVVKSDSIHQAIISGGKALAKAHARNQKRWRKLSFKNVFVALNALLRSDIEPSDFVKIVKRIHTNLRNRIIVEVTQIGKNGSFLAFSLLSILFPPSIPIVLAALAANVGSTIVLVGTEKALENKQLHLTG